MPISPDKIKFLLILAKKSRKITGKFFPVVRYFTWKLELVSDIYNLRYLHKQKSLLFSWGLDTNWKFMVILWTLNRGLGLILLKKLDYLLDICMLTQGCYPLGTQSRFWPFFCCLVHPFFQNTYVWKLSHWVLATNLQISFPFFQRALPLAALSVSWCCYKSFISADVLNYYICVICSFHIL